MEQWVYFAYAENVVVSTSVIRRKIKSVLGGRKSVVRCNGPCGV